MNPISPDPTTPPTNRRRLILAGAGAVGVLLGLVLLASMGAGSDVQPPPPSPPAGAGPEPAEPEIPPAGVDPDLAFAVGRDPFEQLVADPDPEAAGESAGGEAPAPAPPPAGDGGAAPAPQPPAPAPAPQPPAPAPAPQPPAPAAPAPAPQPPAPPPADVTTAPPVDDPPTPGYWHFPTTPGYWYFPPASRPPAQEPPAEQPPAEQPPGQQPPPEVLNDPEQLVRWMFEHMRLWSVITDDTGTRRAFITIDDRAYLPAEGQVFGDHFRVERIDPDCVEVSATTLHYGICLPTAGEAGDPTPGQPTAAQACVVPRPAPPDTGSTGRPRLALAQCERVAPMARFPIHAFSPAGDSAPAPAPGVASRSPHATSGVMRVPGGPPR